MPRVVVLCTVVKALQVQRSVGAVDTVVVGRHWSPTKRVQLLDEGFEPQHVARDVGGVAENLVAERPDDNAWVIAVPADQDLALGVLPVPVVLVPEQVSHRVTSVEEGRSWNVVCRPPSVRIHLLQLGDSVTLQHIWDGNADAGKVLVVRIALDLHPLVVEPEAGVGRPHCLPDAKGCIDSVNGGPSDSHRHPGGVYRLRGAGEATDVPQLGVGNRDVRQLHGGVTVGRHRPRPASLANHTAVWTEDLGQQADRRW
mmetsp:Transcript_12839/g.32883  ORF Transcript_12839/g.32883 Transcript_12839/m.32883 type:complete len:256 (+) Transcript_12839:1121-1888(+)